mmetsp:Transcript_11571/g.30779  ORF Transcript_11571/g.30779 Transcript_11571/m.30779 type:complete len:220 (+) Transcript_11571:251-910(+)
MSRWAPKRWRSCSLEHSNLIAPSAPMSAPRDVRLPAVRGATLSLLPAVVWPVRACSANTMSFDGDCITLTSPLGSTWNVCACEKDGSRWAMGASLARQDAAGARQDAPGALAGGALAGQSCASTRATKEEPLAPAAPLASCLRPARKKAAAAASPRHSTRGHASGHAERKPQTGSRVAERRMLSLISSAAALRRSLQASPASRQNSANPWARSGLGGRS